MCLYCLDDVICSQFYINCILCHKQQNSFVFAQTKWLLHCVYCSVVMDSVIFLARQYSELWATHKKEKVLGKQLLTHTTYIYRRCLSSAVEILPGCQCARHLVAALIALQPCFALPIFSKSYNSEHVFRPIYNTVVLNVKTQY